MLTAPAGPRPPAAAAEVAKERPDRGAEDVPEDPRNHENGGAAPAAATVRLARLFLQRLGGEDQGVTLTVCSANATPPATAPARMPESRMALIKAGPLDRMPL